MTDRESSPDKNPRARFFAPAKEVDVIAHRGGNGQWPGETIYAFDRALQGGADVIEMDVWGTADNPPVLVLMHSSDVGKTTDGTKKLPFCKFADLENLNAAYRWSPDGGETFPFANTKPVLRVEKLEDVLKKFKDHRMNIEIKQNHPSIVKPFLDLVEACGVPSENLLIASFYTKVLKEFREESERRNLPIATSASTWEWLKFYFCNYLFHLRYERPEKGSPEAIQMAERIPIIRFWLLSRRFIRRAQDAGFTVHAWTVDTSNDMQRAIVSGVDGIITDFPGPLRAIVDEPDRDKSLPRDKTIPLSSRFFNKWSLFRTKLAGLFSILTVVRFSLAVVLLPAIAMIFIPQGTEALRILAKAKNHPTQVTAFIISLIILTFMAWYWASILVDVLRPGAREEGSLKGWSARQLPRICGLIPALAIAVALIVAYEPFKKGTYPQTSASQTSAVSFDPTLQEVPPSSEARPAIEVKDSPRKFFVFALMSFAFTLPVYWGFHKRRRHLENYYRRQKGLQWQLGKRVPDGSGVQQIPLKHLPKTSKRILAITMLAWLVLLVFFVIQTGDHPITIRPAQAIGPLAILMFFAAVWIPLGSLLVFWADMFKFPVFTILLLLAGTFSLADINDNHQIRRIDNNGPPPISDVKSAFDNWLKHRCDLNPNVPYPVFIVSAEGGGLRAAYFTSLVLSAAEDRNPQFAHHVFAISGVSGGSVGGSVFAALADKYVHAQKGSPCSFVKDLPDKPGTLQKKTMQDMTNEILGQDLLSPVLAGALYPDLIQRFLFWPVSRFDRARGLEDGLGEAWLHATNTREFSNRNSFYQLGDNFPQKSTPALFLNTTQVETGQRMVVSSLDLAQANGQPDEDLSGLLGINHIKNVEPPNLSLSTAAFLSARFPFITPPGSIGQDKAKTRYVDGGYFEISGAATLIDIISALSNDHFPTAQSERPMKTPQSQPPTQPIKLIVINIGTDPADMKFRLRGIGELTGPIVALLNTRSARGTGATNQLETVVSKLNSIRLESDKDAVDPKSLAEVVHFQAYETNTRLPTGWLLSDGARENMQCQLGIGRSDRCDVTEHRPRNNVRNCENDRVCLDRISTLLNQ
jgi:glycerophosphoryl diester phosphodiesterase